MKVFNVAGLEYRPFRAVYYALFLPEMWTELTADYDGSTIAIDVGVMSSMMRYPYIWRSNMRDCSDKLKTC